MRDLEAVAEVKSTILISNSSPRLHPEIFRECAIWWVGVKIRIFFFHKNLVFFFAPVLTSCLCWLKNIFFPLLC
jgi:hypothetical protein